MSCQECGNQLPDGAKFCGVCGSKQKPTDVAGESTASTPRPPASAATAPEAAEPVTAVEPKTTRPALETMLSSKAEPDPGDPSESASTRPVQPTPKPAPTRAAPKQPAPKPAHPIEPAAANDHRSPRRPAASPESHPNPPRTTPRPGTSLPWFIDFRFTRMLTPTLVKIAYVLGSLVLALITLGFVVVTFAQAVGSKGTPAFLLVVPVELLFGLLMQMMLRVTLEFFVSLVRNAEDTHAIRALLESQAR